MSAAVPETIELPSHSSLRRALVFVLFLLLFVYAWSRARPGGSGSARDSSGRLHFAEVAAEVGVDFVHQPTRIDSMVDVIAAQITATGAAVSVCDYDADGHLDLYATTSATGSANALFHNLGNGRFQDEAASAGLADLNRASTGCSMGSVWGDFDNDGFDDVFVYKWGVGQLFRNRGDTSFEDVTAGSGLEHWVNSNSANWFDYDRDGVLDLLVTGYFAEEHNLWDLKSTRIMQDSFEFSHNGGLNYLYRGRGDGTFEDVSNEVGLTQTRWTYATVAADFDRDGWLDLYVSNDYGTEELYLNRSGERFELAENIGIDGESKSGMSVALGDITDGEHLAVYVTNISKVGFLFQGNNLRVNYLDKLGLMMPIQGASVADCGWAWGAQFCDLDNDSWQDLIVVNGFVSANPERDYWYQMSKIGLATGDVIEDAAQWPAMEDRSLSGYERTRVLLNRGRRGGYFGEVGEAVGIDDRFDGRAVAVADLFGTGRLDAIIANQGGPLLLYRNESDPSQHWLELRLFGHASGTNAYGAEVRIEQAGRKQLRVHTAASGFSSQNGPVLHFGLGAESMPVKVTVSWPSGEKQVLEGLALDELHQVEEPQ